MCESVRRIVSGTASKCGCIERDIPRYLGARPKEYTIPSGYGPLRAAHYRHVERRGGHDETAQRVSAEALVLPIAW